MAFLDNSGDIILDAVLTDTGRMRLAKGDGSFKISKYAFGDDEIDYSSYNGNNSSGSAYCDLEILQTPILEAFTNNSANMKSKLVSLTNNNLLYLPVIQLNEGTYGGANFKPAPSDQYAASGSHVLMVDQDTQDALLGVGLPGTSWDDTPALIQANTEGFMNGAIPTTDGNMIRADQGLNTTEVSPALILDPELVETQYIVEMDSRFCKPYDKAASGTPVAQPSFIDDDLLATYYFTSNVGSYVQNSISGKLKDASVKQNNETIQGPRGTNIRFGLLASTDVVTSDYLFTTLGNELPATSDRTFYYIDTMIRITGVTTGYRLDVPLRLLKIKQGS